MSTADMQFKPGQPTPNAGFGFFEFRGNVESEYLKPKEVSVNVDKNLWYNQFSDRPHQTRDGYHYHCKWGNPTREWQAWVIRTHLRLKRRTKRFMLVTPCVIAVVGWAWSILGQDSGGAHPYAKYLSEGASAEVDFATIIALIGMVALFVLIPLSVGGYWAERVDAWHYRRRYGGDLFSVPGVRRYGFFWGLLGKLLTLCMLALILFPFLM